jgi:transcriptional regulator with XRE-family HTH domain
VLCLRCADAPGVAFGQRLRALRIAAGLTLAALGKRVGLSTTCIFLAEHDRHALRADTVEKLVSVLGTRLMKGIEQ